MFVSFCIDHARIDREMMPISSNCQNWIGLLNSERYQAYYPVNDRNGYPIYTSGKSFNPEPGDLIFFNWDETPNADHIGFVYSVIRDANGNIVRIDTIEGNAGDTVTYRQYEYSDPRIMGYGKMPKNPEQPGTLTELEATYEGFKAKAEFEAGTFPDDTTMCIRLLNKEDNSESFELLKGVAKERKLSIIKNYLFDISFMDAAGNEIEPEGKVKVSIDFPASDSDNKVDEDLNLSWELVHITDQGETEKLTEETSTVIATDNNEATSLEFENDAFSEYALLALADENATYLNMTGSAKLPALSATTASGTAGYYVHPKNYYYYQISSHEVNIRDSSFTYYCPTFVLVKMNAGETSKSWTPNTREYIPGASNYDVVYCGDYGKDANPSNGEYITKTPLKDANVTSTAGNITDTLTDAQKIALNAIVLNCYPYVSAEDMISAAKAAGYSLSDNVGEAELLNAAQITIWRHTNPTAHAAWGGANGRGYHYGTQETTAKSGQLNPLADSQCNWSDQVSNTVVKSDVDNLIAYLEGIGAAARSWDRGDSISVEDFDVMKTDLEDGTYTYTVQLTLNRSLTFGERLTARLVDKNNQPVSDELLSLERDTNTMTLVFNSSKDISAGDPVRILLEGSAGDARQVYYYYSSTIQNLIGVTGGLSLQAETTVKSGTSISVHKVWIGGDDSDYQPIQVQLYQNEQPYGDPVTLSADLVPAWYYQWNNLPKNDPQGNAYSYTVQEITDVPGYTSQISVTEEGIDEEKELEVTTVHLTTLNKNTKPTSGKEYVFVKADDPSKALGTSGNNNDTIQWVSFDSSYLPDTARWKLTASGNNWVMQNVANGRYLQMNDNYVFNTSSNSYGMKLNTAGFYLYATRTGFFSSYDYVLTSISGGQGSSGSSGGQAFNVYRYDGTTKETVKDVITHKGDINYLIENTKHVEEKTSVSVKKIWVGGDEEDYKPVQVRLLQNGSSYQAEGIVNPAELNAEGNWQYIWTDLPKFDESGEEYRYSVEEITLVPGFIMGQPEDDPESMLADHNFKVTNTEAEKTSLSVRKIWQGGDDHPSEIVVTLYQNGVKYEAEGIMNPVTLDESNNWYYFWKRLPIKDENDTPYEYTVAEDPVEGYTSTIAYSNPGDDDDDADIRKGIVHADITNSKINLYDIELNKTSKADPEVSLKGAEFELYMVDENGTSLVPTVSGVHSTLIGTYVTGEDGKASIEGLTGGKEYYLIETKAPDGFSKNAEAIHFTIINDTGVVEIISGNEEDFQISGLQITVKDKPGTVLPHTGGSGTTKYTMAGLLLILLAACLMYKKIRGKEAC